MIRSFNVRGTFPWMRSALNIVLYNYIVKVEIGHNISSNVWASLCVVYIKAQLLLWRVMWFLYIDLHHSPHALTIAARKWFIVLLQYSMYKTKTLFELI